MTTNRQTSEHLAFLEAKIIEVHKSISTNQGRTQEEVSADFVNRRKETIAILKLLALGQHEIDQGRYKSMDDVFAERDRD